MKRKADYPPVPSQVFSTLGPLPVTFDHLEGARGLVEFGPRTVTILPGMNPATEWQVYWHEALHVALLDSGLTNSLTEKQEENICDAIGSYLAAAVRAGFITIKETPK